MSSQEGNTVVRRSHRVLFRLFPALALLTFFPVLSTAEPAWGRPNIILIQTDDQTRSSARSSFIDRDGRRRQTMPNLERFLRQGGTEFTNYIVSSPSCAPSRAALLSGRYGHNTGMTGNGTPGDGDWEAFRQSSIGSDNLAVDLQEAGYRTVHIGKFFNGYKGSDPDSIATEIPPGWDRWFTLSARGDAQSNSVFYYGYHLNSQGVEAGPFGSRDYSLPDNRDPSTCTPLSFPRCNHQTDHTTSVALEEILDSNGSPLYLQLDFSVPHADALPRAGPEPSARHLGSAVNTPLPSNPQTLENRVTDKPLYVRQQGPVTAGLRSQLRQRYIGNLEALRGVDDALGLIVSTLQVLGRLDDTYIFFTSDNGFFFGEHTLRGSKYSHYQASSRVPMLVRGPDVPTGEVSRELVSNIDLRPTFSELAGGGSRADGRSLAPFWRNPERRTLRPIVIENRTSPERVLRSNFKDNYRGIVTDRYKFVSYEDGQEELYDLQRDPYELYNQVRNPDYGALTTELSALLSEYRDCENFECRRPAEVGTVPGSLLRDASPAPRWFPPGELYLYRDRLSASFSCPRKSVSCKIRKKVVIGSRGLVLNARLEGVRKAVISRQVPSDLKSAIDSALWWQRPVEVEEFRAASKDLPAKRRSFKARVIEN